MPAPKLAVLVADLAAEAQRTDQPRRGAERFNHMPATTVLRTRTWTEAPGRAPTKDMFDVRNRRKELLRLVGAHDGSEAVSCRVTPIPFAEGGTQVLDGFFDVRGPHGLWKRRRERNDHARAVKDQRNVRGDLESSRAEADSPRSLKRRQVKQPPATCA